MSDDDDISYNREGVREVADNMIKDLNKKMKAGEATASHHTAAINLLRLTGILPSISAQQDLAATAEEHIDDYEDLGPPNDHYYKN